MRAGLLALLRNAHRVRAKRIALVIGGTLVSVLAIPAAAGLRLNDSPSLPLGIYVVTSDESADLVEFCPPEPFGSFAALRGYREPGSCPDGGAPLMKPIAARSGDTVRISAAGIAVNGREIPRSQALTLDTKRRALQHWPFGTYAVQPGTVWLISSYNARSFDSRYFGPIRIMSLRYRLRPLLTLW